jgi:phage replication O-like protein O
VPGPQTEEGYLKIANELYDALIAIRISGEENQCLRMIIRKTYGWGKKEDIISLSQFTTATGMRKQHVLRAIKKLKDKNMIVTKKGNDGNVTYCLNKHYGKWKALPKKVTLPKKVISVTKNGDKALPKMGNTKDTITKDTITKDKEEHILNACSVLDYLNDIATKKFKSRLNGKITASLQIIIDRLKEGYTREECKKVIDNKWADPFYQDNKGLMCPQTLFVKSKFDAKLNAVPESKLPQPVPPSSKRFKPEDLM